MSMLPGNTDSSQDNRIKAAQAWAVSEEMERTAAHEHVEGLVEIMLELDGVLTTRTKELYTLEESCEKLQLQLNKAEAILAKHSALIEGAEQLQAQGPS